MKFFYYIIILSIIEFKRIFSNILNLTSINIELNNYKNQQFYGNIFFNNTSRFILYDTGSSIVWVKDNNTQMINCDFFNECQYKLNEYLGDQLFYYIVSYRTGIIAIKNVRGNIGFNNKNIIVDNFKYGVSILEQKNVFSKLPFHGIAGLSLKKGSLLDIFSQNNLLKNNVFSFDLNKNILNFGEIMFNNKYNFTDVVNDSYEYDLWKIELNSFIIGNIDLCLIYRARGEKCIAIIDSGTSYYTASNFFIRKLKEIIKLQKFCENYNDIPNIKLIFKKSKYDTSLQESHFELTLNNYDYISKKNMNLEFESNNEIFSINKCELDFIPYNSLDNKNEIILGIRFLKKYYTVFDFQRKIIGFSKYNDKYDQIDYLSLIKSESEMDLLIDDWKKIYG